MMVDGVIQEFGKSYVLNEALVEFYEPVRKGSKVVALYWYGKDLEKILQGYNLQVMRLDDSGNTIDTSDISTVYVLRPSVLN